MKVWAEHQKSQGETVVKCPFCREDFGPFEMLKYENRNAEGGQQGGRMDRHLGTTCRSCRASPIEGKCYRCSSCTDFHLCQSCFNSPIHTQHAFQYRHVSTVHELYLARSISFCEDIHTLNKWVEFNSEGWVEYMLFVEAEPAVAAGRSGVRGRAAPGRGGWPGQQGDLWEWLRSPHTAGWVKLDLHIIFFRSRNYIDKCFMSVCKKLALMTQDSELKAEN